MKKRKVLKKKAVSVFAGFLIFMFTCSIVSRGVYAYRMPQVAVASPDSGMLSHEFEVEGKLEAVSQKAVVAISGIRVQDIRIRQGEAVRKGDVLFRLDTSELREKVNRIQTDISDLQEKMSRQEQQQKRQKAQTDANEREAKRRRRERQKKDMKTLDTELTRQVEKAKAVYQAARLELSSYPSWQEYLAEQKDTSSEYLSLKAAAEKKEAQQTDREALSIFEVTLESRAKKEWSQGREALEQSRKQAWEAWQEARNSRKETLQRQREQNRRDNEDTDSGDKEDPGADETAIEHRKAIAAKQASMDKYKKLLKNDGNVVCERSGIIEKINVSIGERTPDGAAVIFSDTSGGLRFSAMITEQQKPYVKIGDSVELSFHNGEVKLKEIPITGIQDKGNGNAEVVMELKSDEVVQGESGKMKIRAQSVRQDCYIPIAGLYAGATENYVLVLQEKETFLGMEYSVEKRKVDVSDKNDRYAALKGAPVAAEERIIVSSDKEIRPGDRVRMLEGDE